MPTSSPTRARTFEYLDVTALATGHRMRVPVHVVSGVRPGPTLCIGATGRGDEIASVPLLRQLLDGIAPDTLSGKLVVVPLMNPSAFETQTSFTRLDDWSLDEAFPVSTGGMLTWARGWATQQLASAIAELVEQADCVLELRSGTHNTVANAVPVRVQPDASTAARVLELSRALGLDALYTDPPPVASLGDFAAQRSIPLVSMEIGGGFPEDARLVQRGLQGILSLMRSLGMLPGQVTLTRQLLFRDHRLIRAPHGGMFYPEVGPDQLGRGVPEGAVLGRIVHPLSLREIAVVTAPYPETYLLMLRSLFSVVHPGDPAVRVADARTGEQLTST